jgi:hypothetical protein
LKCYSCTEIEVSNPKQEVKEPVVKVIRPVAENMIRVNSGLILVVM